MNCLDSETRFWFQLHIYRTDYWSWLPIQVQFSNFPESILLVVMIQHLVEECIHDKLSQRTVHQCLSSWNTVPLQQHVQILSPYKIYSLCFLVTAIGSVLQIAAIEDSGVMGCHSPNELLPWFHWEQLIVPSVHQVAPIYLDGFQLLHTCLLLLRKDRAWLAKTIMRKIVSIVAWSAQ